MTHSYDSPTAFNRAFQGVHGFPPSNAKSEGVKLKAFPTIKFKLTIKGEAEMIYKIEIKEAFRIVGVSEKRIDIVTRLISIITHGSKVMLLRENQDYREHKATGDLSAIGVVVFCDK